MKATFLPALALTLTTLGSTAMATTVTTDYDGTSPIVGNCIPFGCPDSYGSNMGFVYQGIDAFTLNVGDVIAFDTGTANDNELSFDLSLGATTTDGGETVDSNGFTTVASLGAGIFGDTIVGNYDIAFTITTAFTFGGGGLIVDFENTNGAVEDTNFDGALVSSSDNPFTVRRYFNGDAVGDMSNSRATDGQTVVGNMRIITSNVPAVPLPAGGLLMLTGLAGLAAVRRRKAAA